MHDACRQFPRKRRADAGTTQIQPDVWLPTRCSAVKFMHDPMAGLDMRRWPQAVLHGGLSRLRQLHPRSQLIKNPRHHRRIPVTEGRKEQVVQYSAFDMQSSSAESENRCTSVIQGHYSRCCTQENRWSGEGIF